MEKFAPIVLFVYNRPEHTRKTLEALQKNSIADQSQLFIYSDGPKQENDSKKVTEVRKFIYNISGFQRIEIVERDKNIGLANSVITGVSELFNDFDRLIVLEDDIVTSPFLLSFMNEALECYEKVKNIFSVSGYTYPITLPADYKQDVFIAYRPSSWGWATWKDRWEKADWEMNNLKAFLKNKEAKNKFSLAGEDLISMLLDQVNRRVDSWAIRWAYTHFKNNAYCLYPKSSLCNNIGMDSTGTHSASSKKFYVDLNNSRLEIKLEKNLKFDKAINVSIQNLFRPSLVRRLINFIK